jgi:hypothetical protein
MIYVERRRGYKRKYQYNKCKVLEELFIYECAAVVVAPWNNTE